MYTKNYFMGIFVIVFGWAVTVMAPASNEKAVRPTNASVRNGTPGKQKSEKRPLEVVEDLADEQSTYDQLDDLTIEEEADVDINRKSKESKQLVLNAVKHMQKVSVARACEDFLYNEAWRKGEMYVFVYTADGICYAQGDTSYFIWKNITEIKGLGGTPLIKEMAAVAQKAGV